MYSFHDLEQVCCSMSGSNCCFLTFMQISQEAGKVVWYSHLFKNFHLDIYFIGASQVALVVKNLPADAGDPGLLPGWGRSPGGGYGNPLQYCCLENLTDRGAQQATVHGVTKSWTQLKQLSMDTLCCIFESC